MARTPWLLVVTLALAVAAPAARAQDPPQPKPDTPKPDTPKPDTPPAPPPVPRAPVAPDELLRVRAELERIEAERKRLAGNQAELERRAREIREAQKSLPTTPVLRRRETVRAITLRETVGKALAENADLLVAYLQASSFREAVPVEEAAFDPTLSWSGAYARNRSPFFSTSPFSGLPPGLRTSEQKAWQFSTKLAERFPTGTTASVEYLDGWGKNNNSFALNPTFNPRLKFELNQNLLRGFGLEPNLAGIRAAELDADGAEAGYVQRLMDVVFQVESAYWDVVRAEANLKTNEASLRSAMELLNDQRKRKELGAATGLEVTIAEAGVAQRREGVIVAENQLEASRDQLIRITEKPGAPNRYDVFLVPIDSAPDVLVASEPEVEKAIETALARRPDYRQTILAVAAAKQRLTQAENGALPTVDAFFSFEEAGLGRSWPGAWRALDGNFYSWSLGVRVELPLFLRAERARSRRAMIDVERAEAAQRAQEAQVQLDVRKALRDVRTARARTDAARVARELAEKQLEAVRQEVRFGVSVPRQILDFQRDLAQSQTLEVQAHIDHRLALTGLARAQGLVLDGYEGALPGPARDALQKLRQR